MGCILLPLALVKGFLGVRSVANERLGDLFGVPAHTIFIFEVADVLVDEPRLLILIVSVLEDLCVLAHLHK